MPRGASLPVRCDGSTSLASSAAASCALPRSQEPSCLLAWPASSKNKPVDAAALASHVRGLVGTACKSRLLSPGGGSPATRRGLSRLSSGSPAALDHAWTSLQDVRAAAEERERAHTEAIEQLELAHARKLSEFATFAAGCLQLARSPSSLSQAALSEAELARSPSSLSQRSATPSAMISTRLARTYLRV